MMNWTKWRFRILSAKYIGKPLIALNYKKLAAFSSNRWGGHTFGDEIKKQFSIFLTEQELKDKRLLNKLKVDIIQSYYRYGACPLEFFLFGFRNHSNCRRSEYLTIKHKDDMMRERVGMGENWEMLEDKYKFYQRFSEFFQRDVLLFDNNCSIEEFISFVNKHRKFIAKPLGGQCGRDVEILTVDSYHSIDEMYVSVKRRGIPFIFEQLIIQAKEFAEINESSVNTIRLPSFINKSGFHVLKPCLRMGRKGQIVDNAGSGGIVCVIDEQTGQILTHAADELGRIYETHPDSNHILKGWTIPRWKELLAFAETIHRTIPFYPYVGWDFALTADGWVLIEGNWGQFLSEFVDHEGIKSRFDAMFD